MPAGGTTYDEAQKHYAEAHGRERAFPLKYTVFTGRLTELLLQDEGFERKGVNLTGSAGWRQTLILRAQRALPDWGAFKETI